MPPRTSQCCRALHRSTQPHVNRFGVSDIVLAAVFEQYCSVAKIQVRHGSFVPGPFENRRRDGRRRMGELRLGQTAGSAAPWELENVPDLTQWRWTPPTSAARRIRQHLRTGHRSLLKTVFHSSLHPLSTLWGAVSAFIHPAALSVQQAGATPIDFIELGFAQISQDLSRDPSLSRAPKFLDYCQYLEQALSSGRLKGSDVTVLFSNLHQGLRALASPQLCGMKALSTVQDMVLVLIKSIANGLASQDSSNGPLHHDSQLYSSLLLALSEIRRNEAAAVLNAVIAGIPEQCMGALTQEIDTILEAFFFSAARKNDLGAATTLQSNELLQAWLSLDSTRHLEILNAATRTALASVHSSRRTSTKVRLAWLRLLTRLPYVSMDYLATACAYAEAGKRTPPLSGEDICELLLARLARHGYLGPARDTVNIRAKHAKASCFYPLGSDLGERGDIMNLLRAAKFLASAGREQDVRQLLRGAKRALQAGDGALSSKSLPLFDLAVACESPSDVIRVLEKYTKNSSLSAEYYWQSKQSLADLTKMVALRKISRAKVLSALQLDAPVRGRSVPRIMHKSNVQTQKAIRLAQAAVANAARSDRSAFETVFHCVNYVRKHQGRVPTALLKCVHQLVKNDLRSGKLGVQVRMKWYLDLVGMKSGPEIRLKTAQALQRWREHNRELARHEQCRTQE
ncbi:uncharacterized protein B0I36DRAFT_317537 [Microdochium trichocladiopsis]|uniref:Uncharacterized protein n=1 Tax=Microdochium trichocladiopsis TaxID=1682393 RepID=A0A9P9BWH1_9PEZI|nr:uncharacterized protein B0I36DRAFT_317537 [Microdochium trichocladiopsis]KAH7035071.1 hypothetical protein B0I36DRAFT_317537 [Microdochium trichocladiopsis]